MTTTTDPAPIPLDPQQLYGLISRTPNAERFLLRNRLVAQLGDPDRAHRLFDPIESDVFNAEQITSARDDLRTAVGAALTAVTRVRQVHDLLAGELYDVEYAEGGDLFTHFLQKAHLALRTAAAVNPVRAACVPVGQASDQGECGLIDEGVPISELPEYNPTA